MTHVTPPPWIRHCWTASWTVRSDSGSLIAGKSRPTLTCITVIAASARLQGHTAVGWDGLLVWWGCLSTLYSTMQAQKCRISSQLDGVFHHQLQKYLFRVSESLKIEAGSPQDITKCPAISCPTFTQACSKVGWDDVPHIPFYNHFDGKWEGHQWQIQDRALGGAAFQTGTPISQKQSDFACLRPNK